MLELCYISSMNLASPQYLIVGAPTRKNSKDAGLHKCNTSRSLGLVQRNGRMYIRSVNEPRRSATDSVYILSLGAQSNSTISTGPSVLHLVRYKI